MKKILYILLLLSFTNCNSPQKDIPNSIHFDTSKDPDYLRLNFLLDTFSISLKSKVLKTPQINLIENFIKENKDLINGDKVVVTIKLKDNEDLFKEVKSIFKRNGISKFKIINKEN
jgi:hypothetical protein